MSMKLNEKQCTYCKTYRPIESFIGKKGSETKTCSFCREAKLLYDLVNKKKRKDYRKNNSERIKGYKKLYRTLNVEKLVNYRKDYYEEHSENEKQKSSEYYLKNREKILNRRKLSRQSINGINEGFCNDE